MDRGDDVLNKNKFKKRILKIALFVLPVLLFMCLFGFFPIKSQTLVFSNDAKTVRYYDDFMSELANKYPLGSSESNISNFWQSQTIPHKPYKRELSGKTKPDNVSHVITYDFDKLFSGSCFLSKGKGSVDRLIYSFNEENELVTAMLLNSCGVYAYKTKNQKLAKRHPALKDESVYKKMREKEADFWDKALRP